MDTDLNKSPTDRNYLTVVPPEAVGPAPPHPEFLSYAFPAGHSLKAHSGQQTFDRPSNRLNFVLVQTLTDLARTVDSAILVRDRLSVPLIASRCVAVTSE